MRFYYTLGIFCMLFVNTFSLRSAANNFYFSELDSIPVNDPCTAIDLNALPCQKIPLTGKGINPVTYCYDQSDLYFKYRVTTSKGTLRISYTAKKKQQFVLKVYTPGDSCHHKMRLIEKFEIKYRQRDTFLLFNTAPGQNYIFGISDQSRSDSIQLCFSEVQTPAPCAPNFVKYAAQTLDIAPMTLTDTCIAGCISDLSAQRSTNFHRGSLNNFPGTWYKLPPLSQGWLRAEIISDAIKDPGIALFDNCFNLIDANFYEMDLDVFEHYLFVYDFNGRQGDFKLCLKVLDKTHSCASRGIFNSYKSTIGYAAAKSCDEIRYEYTIELLSFFDLSEWAHAVYPQFSACFNKPDFVEPENAKLPDPHSNYYWEWCAPGTLHWKPDETPQYVGINSVTGQFCLLWEPDCRPIIPGMECSEIGEPLPAAWVCRKYSLNCGSDAPNLSWGVEREDIPVTFSFSNAIPCDLLIDECNDLKVTILGTSDGQSGGWKGTACTDIMPSTLKVKVLPCDSVVFSMISDTVCPNIPFFKELTLNDSVNKVRFIPDSLAFTYGAAGYSGVEFQQTIRNKTDDILPVHYTMIPISNRGCEGVPSRYTLYVYPEIKANAGPDQLICTGSVPLRGSGKGKLNWRTTGDGFFSEPNDSLTNYRLGSRDLQSDTIVLILDVINGDFPFGCNIDIDTVLLTHLNIHPEFYYATDSCDLPLCVHVPDDQTDYTFTWNTGQNTQCIDPADDEVTATVTITAPGGCAQNFSYNLSTRPKRFSFTYEEKNATDGQLNGSVHITFTRNIPLHYTWRDSQGNIISTAPQLDAAGMGIYTVEVVDSQGCSEILGPFSIMNTVANNNLVLTDNYILYPNPGSGTFYLKNRDKASIPDKIQLVSITGNIIEKNVLLMQDKSGRIDSADLPEGIYQLIFSVSGRTYQGKLIMVR